MEEKYEMDNDSQDPPSRTESQLMENLTPSCGPRKEQPHPQVITPPLETEKKLRKGFPLERKNEMKNDQ